MVRPILVVGEALIDLLPTTDGRLRVAPGGGPYNAARTLGRLGLPVAFVGRLSDDRFGAVLRDGLIDAGVDLRHAVPTSAPTTLAVAEVDTSGSATYRFYLAGTSAPVLTPADVAVVLDGLIAGRFAALHVGTLGVALDPIGATVERLVAAAPASTRVLFDVNARPAALPDPARSRARVLRLAARADIVKVSRDDLLALGPDEATALAELRAGGAPAILHTDGAGEIRIRVGSATEHVPVPAIPVVDTVGAGDAFSAGVLAALPDPTGDAACPDLPSVRRAVRVGITVAGLTCQRPGADPPTRAAVDAALAAQGLSLGPA